MILEEYDEELHIRNEKAISYEDGLRDGIRQGIEQGVQQGLEQGIRQGAEERKSLQMEIETLRKEIEQLKVSG